MIYSLSFPFLIKPENIKEIHIVIKASKLALLRRTVQTILLLVILSVVAAAQDVATQVDEYINRYVKNNLFSGAVLVAKGGKVILSKGYGMANYELDVANVAQTKFRLGSITKQFTAMAILQLQEKGLLSVDDLITKYFPDYKIAEKVTIHHLLTHTSGIHNFTNDPEYGQTMMIASPVEKTIARFKDKPLDFAPGEKWDYSNSGYILLGAIIEKASGKSYEDYLKENIFQPLNMVNTGYDHSDALLKNRAAGYQMSRGKIANASYLDMSIPYSAGALYSTVEDLYLWDRALYTEKLVKKATLEKMFTPIKSNYGYGWAIEDQKGHKRISHGGGINGFGTQINRYVNDDACVIMLSNLVPSPVGKISNDLGTIAFGEKLETAKERTEVKVDPKIYDAYVGQYELAPAFILTITKEDDHLFGQATGQGKIEIFPESEKDFFLKITDAQITFVKNDKGEVTQLILHQGGQDRPARKIK
jgi:Beta-lactamase class C and other penicillin binding proteins